MQHHLYISLFLHTHEQKELGALCWNTWPLNPQILHCKTCATSYNVHQENLLELSSIDLERTAQNELKEYSCFGKHKLQMQ